MVAAILPVHRAGTLSRLSLRLGAQPRKQGSCRQSSSQTPPPPSDHRVPTSQARALRSIISLYHSSENFAPLNSNERLVQFIDDSLLFKKPPSPYSATHSPNFLSTTIRSLTLNKTILRAGETEQDLNPIVSSHRIRAGNQRWMALKDALCGTCQSETLLDTPRPSSRFASKFGAHDWSSPSSSTQSSLPKPKPGLEVVQENWEDLQKIPTS
ncbi:hypothetical protein PtB15_13B505 [Puccinia triticina]|nr:hypothetical protein PtB15_13B505 [Puccinia triticina]